ncbi:MAG TPA: 30S ribosomal protein S2 [Candidatus Dependentiae bacterium]|nr:30S ribosomal protein S2 [Candidatus Dependentiae bacterium]HRQ62618.1 30S ribosomal protein S2 [Candidatus Dependentiae bacterium]
MTKQIDFKELGKAGTHFGHRSARWNPKMAPFIWGTKNKVHLIDISKTASHLEQAAKFLESVAADNKTILWVGTKKPAQKAVTEVAMKLGMPYVNHRWIGGTLSNFAQVKKAVTKLLHLEDILAKSEKFPHYTKKELNEFKKDTERLEKSVGGIRTLKWPVGALVLVDVGRENSALLEAVNMHVPVVAIVDTNCDPSLVDYVIPANDDAVSSISLIMNHLGNAVEAGKKIALEKEKEAASEKTKKGEAKKAPSSVEASTKNKAKSTKKAVVEEEDEDNSVDNIIIDDIEDIEE